MLKSLSLLMPLVASGLAANVPFGHAQNLTVGFFPSSEVDEKCDVNNDTPRLILTTNTIPNHYTCFNVADIFSQRNKTGFTNATQHVYNTPEPNGIYWKIESEGGFDENANYSRVWYEQYKSGHIDPGSKARWTFRIYKFPNCTELDPDNKAVDAEDPPIWASSCQTEPGGECQTTPYSVGSFAIHGNSDKEDDKCMEWKQYGAAVGLQVPWLSVLAGVGAVYAALS